jgi:lipoprotein-anchoring transpeptidase ErfK/SrfK
MRPGGPNTAARTSASPARAGAGLAFMFGTGTLARRVALAATLLITACSGPAVTAHVGGGAGSTPGSSSSAVSSPQSKASVAIEPAAHAKVSPDTSIVVRATVGRLTSVVVRPKAGGRSLAGTLSSDGLSWTAAPGLLPLNTSYVVDAAAVDSSGLRKLVTSSFSTLKPKAVLRTVVNPGDGALVGAGMPIMVSFTAPVTDRAAVESRLEVNVSEPVEGSWHWFSDKVVHWRPKTYWPAGEQVTVNLRLAGVDAGGGVWGERDRSYGFTVGDALVSTVDVTAHTMTVRDNGKVLRVIPITTGKAGFLTRGGIKVIMTKERFRVMDSATVDIPAGSPDAYKLKVEYALRLTYSGEFVHAAPWSVAHQGHANVSHGCTGMSLANAAWFYSIAHIGDVVQYVHSTRDLEQGNGYTDWNLSWSDWQAGSSL